MPFPADYPNDLRRKGGLTQGARQRVGKTLRNTDEYLARLTEAWPELSASQRDRLAMIVVEGWPDLSPAQRDRIAAVVATGTHELITS